MLCYRCGSHNTDGSGQCASCGQVFTGAHKMQGAIGSKRVPTAQKLDKKSSPFEIGELVAERFQIEALIGTGPSGTVYKARDSEFRQNGTDEHVALKVVHSRLLQTEEDRALFERSVLRAKKMAHPGVARVYHAGAAMGRSFFTMQLVAGLPLDRIIELRKGQKVFTLAECEPLVQQITNALEYSHRFTAHGMLKPQNIIVKPGELRITDFAMARGLPRKPYFASLGDALHYTAPELRKDGSDVLPAADVFSLGVVLTEMLTGTRPDTVKGRIEVPDAVGMTNAIRTFLLKAMDVAPDRRWRSPSELMQALQSLVDEPMSEPVIITAPVPALEAAGVVTPPPPLPSLHELETQLLPLEPEEELPKIAETKISRGTVDAPKPLAKKKSAFAERQRSVLVSRSREKSNNRAIIAAASVFMLSVSLVTFAVWARAQGLLSKSVAVEKIDEPAPVADLPTPAAVEKQKGNEPAKVASLTSTKSDLGLRPRAQKALAKLAATDPTEPIEPPVVGLDKGALCKKGMVFVSGGRFSMGSSPTDEFHNFSDKTLQSVDVPGFCVDRYEYPNRMGAQPMVNVTQKQAKASCEAEGKRLCGEEEWERACKGPANARFPYGNEYEDGVCNVGSEDGARALKAIGSSSKCRSGFGVVDMSGNVAEMTAASMSGSDVVVKGGDAQHPDYASRCAGRAAQGAQKRAANVGFRCCSAPSE